jgi:hypothetical protein
MCRYIDVVIEPAKYKNTDFTKTTTKPVNYTVTQLQYAFVQYQHQLNVAHVHKQRELRLEICIKYKITIKSTLISF